MKVSCKQCGLESWWWWWGEKAMGAHIKSSVWYLYSMISTYWDSVAVETMEIQGRVMDVSAFKSKAEGCATETREQIKKTPRRKWYQECISKMRDGQLC